MENKSQSRLLKILFTFLAICLLIVYFLYCFVIPQTPARISRPSASLVSDFPLWSWIISLHIPVPDTSSTVAVFLVVTTMVTFAIYGLLVFLSWKLRSSSGLLALVLVFTSLYYLLSTLALPNLNTDIYNYMLRGRLAVVYKMNPYRFAADEISSDPVYPYASHGYTSVPEWWKLPLWTSVEVGLAKLTGNDVSVNLLIYRVAFLVVNILNLLLIALIIRKGTPKRLIPGLVIFAWNPIIVVLGQSKGDTFIVFLLLLAIVLMVYGRKNLAVIPLTMSVLTKLTTLPFLAAYLLMTLRREKWKDYIILGILFTLTAAIFYIQFDVGDFIATQFFGIIGMSASSAPDLIRVILRASFIILILYIGITRSGEPKQMIWGWLVLAVFFSLFLIDYGKAWYLIPLIALAALIPDWRTIFIAYILSFQGFLMYMWNLGFDKDFPAPIFSSIPGYIINLTPLFITFIATGAVFLWRILKRKRTGQVGSA